MNNITLIKSKLEDRIELFTMRHTESRGVSIPIPVYKIKDSPYLIAYRGFGSRHYYIYKDNYSIENLIYESKSQRFILDKLKELGVI